MIYLGLGTVPEYTTKVQLLCDFYVPIVARFNPFDTDTPARCTKGIVGLAGFINSIPSSWDSTYGIGVGSDDSGVGPMYIYIFGGSDNGTSKYSRVKIDNSNKWIHRNIVGVQYGGNDAKFSANIGINTGSYLSINIAAPAVNDLGTVPNSGEWAVFGWNAGTHDTLNTAPIGTRIYELHIYLGGVQYDFYPVKVGNYGGLAKYQDGVFIENLLASNPASVIYGTQTTSRK